MGLPPRYGNLAAEAWMNDVPERDAAVSPSFHSAGPTSPTHSYFGHPQASSPQPPPPPPVRKTSRGSPVRGFLEDRGLTAYDQYGGAADQGEEVFADRAPYYPEVDGYGGRVRSPAPRAGTPAYREASESSV